MKRVEDERFLRGLGRYVDDLRLPDMVHAAFLRSSHPHARIVSVDLDAARSQPGVLAVLDGEALREKCRPIRAVVNVPGFVPTDWPILATERVRFVGEAVALVVAKDRYLAEDAVERITVKYEPLPAVVDVEAAMSPDGALLHPEVRTNILYRHYVKNGDPDQVFERAHLVVRGRFRTQRVTGVPIETRGCLAHYEPGTRFLTLWSSTQVPHILRTALAHQLEMDESHIRIIAPDVGGGFGIKGQLFPEEVAVSVVARELRRPVKWIEDRWEHLMASTHAREHRYEVEAAIRQDGRIEALRARVVVDSGAYSVYPYTVSTEPTHAASLLPGVYDIQDYSCEAFGVVTNKAPVSPYRGVSRPPANFVTERLVEMIAWRLNLDPLEIRLRNIIRDDQFPYRTAAGVVYDSGQYETALRKALSLADYYGFRKRQRETWDSGRYLGIGLSMFVETSAGSSSSFRRRGMPVAGFDMSTVRVLPTGRVEVFTSAASQGQSHETLFAQLVGEALSIPPERVTVAQGDTQLVAYGTGTFGSRSAVMAGGAALLAAQEVRRRAIQIAAHLLEAPTREVSLKDGRFVVSGIEQRGVTWEEVARAAYLATGNRPEGLSQGLEATAVHDLPPGQVPCSYAVHLAIVEVDPETGVFKILRYLVVEDCGTMLNPTVVEGQIIGAVAQGVGAAAYEALIYDEQGQLLTGTLMGYLLPTAVEVPQVEIHHLVTPSPYTLTGAKGMAEGGAVAPPAALANAVCDALQPFGVEISTLPLTPERVREAVVAARNEPWHKRGVP